jgi:hypothetical protein
MMKKFFRKICAVTVVTAAYCSQSAQAQWTETVNHVYVTNAAKNVGIGVSSPAFALDVFRSGNASANFKSGTGTANLIIDRGNSAATSSVSYRTAGTPTWQTGTVGNDNFNIRNIGLGNAAMSINYLNNNIGIGTTAPINKLDVRGAMNCSDTIYLGGNESFAPTGFLKADGPNLRVQGYSSVILGNTDSSSSILTVNYNGLVGINTTGIPGATMHVNGNVKIEDGTQGAGKVLTSDTNGLASWQAISFPAETDPKVGNVATNQVAKWNGTTLVDGIITDDGTKVGIGTTSPSSPLTVVSAPANIPAVRVLPFGTSYRAVMAVDDWGLLQDYFGSGQKKDFSIYQYSKGKHRMLIDTAGNVGFGTTTPAIQLDLDTNKVIGTSKTFVASNDVANRGTKVSFGYDAGSNEFLGMRAIVKAGTNACGNSGDLGFSAWECNTSISREVLRINGRGYVGINTSAPTSHLVINNGSTNAGGDANTILALNNTKNAFTNNALISLKNFNSGDRALQFQINNSSAIATTKAFEFINSSTSLFRILNGGNVAIGNITPGGQFELSLDQGRKPATSTWTITSDARLKNIDGAYTKGLEEIIKLNPIAYHYKNVGDKKFDEKTLAVQAVGFSAQDVQKIFPEAVGTDDDGYLNLNIHAILIASVNALKELNAKVETKDKLINDLQSQLSEMKSCVESLCNATIATPQTKVATTAVQDALFQNQPNPFNESTVIRYALVKQNSNAQIIVRDLNGNLLKTFQLSESGKGEVTVSANELVQGTYTYTLVVNGSAIDTKLMVITK